jgi:hypothetical protein
MATSTISKSQEALKTCSFIKEGDVIYDQSDYIHPSSARGIDVFVSLVNYFIVRIVRARA